MDDFNVRSFPFPDTVENGDVYFHKNMAFMYHAPTNTWEAWRVNKWATEVADDDDS